MKRIRSGLLLAGVFLLAADAASAQMSEGLTARTAADCLTMVQQYPAKQAEAARKAGQQPSYRAYLKQAKELGKECAARFNVQDSAAADLIPLAKLYKAVDDLASAREAVGRRLKMSNLSESERAETLVAAIDIMLSGTPTEEFVKLGEDYTAQVDAMSAAQLKQKIAAHTKMAGYYSYNDIDAPNLAHHATIIKLIDQLPEADKKAYISQRSSAYDYIALVQANRGDAAKAIATLQQGKAENADPRLANMFEDSIGRYSLVGQHVPPLRASAWLNASGDAKQYDTTGRVTMIQFTAQWCGPCRKSYPAMLKMHEQFASRGLDVMLATELYGYFEDRENLKPDEEIAADREYFLGKHKIPFKVLIEPRQDFSDRTPAGEAARKEFNAAKYRVGGIPQIMILDKRGVVRHIMVGWDPANEEAVSREIDRLLKEPDTKQK